MKHLVTGGSGFFGNLVARRLHERGHHVRVLDIWEDTSRPKEIEYLACDVVNREGVAAAMQGVDVVHHNAALVAQSAAGKDYWKVNVEGTRIVTEEAVKAGVQAFIHTSSTSVYGLPPTDGGPITHETLTKPVEAYGRSKLEGEEISETICQQHGLPLITIRPRAILGAGRLGIYQVLFEWIKEGRNVYVIGDGHNLFQFVHAQDVMDFYVVALDRGKTGTYNVGTNKFGTLRQDIGKLIEHAGSPSIIKSLPKGLTINTLRFLHWAKVSPLVPYHYMTYHTSCYFDIQPLLEFDWEPRYSNIDMLKESYDWYLNSKEVHPSEEGSAHRSPLKQGILRLIKQVS
jgi:nucleoside-diphosphate-sugar epimerase